MTDCYGSRGLPSKCNLCQKSESPCVDVQNDHRRVLTVADLTRVPSWNIRQILSCICSRCLLFIGSLTDSSNLLRLNCTNALKGQNATQPQTSLTIDPNATGSVLPQTLTPSPDIVPNNIVAVPCQTKDIGIQVLECTSRTNSPPDQLLSLLEIHHETIVSPLATESGGDHYGSSNIWPSWIPKVPPRECSYCNRSFRRKIDYANHRRRCQAAKMRYSRSMGNSIRKSLYQDDVESIASESAKENRLLEMRSRTPRYRCAQCPAIFKSMLNFKEHTSVHRKQLNCDICGYNTTAQYLFDFHRAECTSKLEIRREKETQIPARRKTRAYSLYISVIAENKSRVSTEDIPNDQITGKTCLDAAIVSTAKPVENSDSNRNCEDPEKSITTKSNSQMIGYSPLTTNKIAGKHMCLHCNRSYKRIDHYKKHMARCAKSLKSLPSGNVNQCSLLEIQSVQQRFNGTQCPATFDSMVPFKEHTSVHSKQFNCDICGYTTTSQYSFDFHRAECISKLKIRRENETQLPVRRNTRAYSQYISVNAANKSRVSTGDKAMGQLTGKTSLDAVTANAAKTVENGEIPEISITTKSNSLMIGDSPFTSNKIAEKHVCLHCNRAYRRKDHYKKHRARCAKSIKSSPFVNVNQRPLLEMQSRSPRFSCTQCPATFTSMVQFKKHTFVHCKQYNCDICGYNTTTQYAFEFHRAECISKQEARREIETTAGKQRLLPARRKTRAFSLYILVTAENKSRVSIGDMANDQIIAKECLDATTPSSTKSATNSNINENCEKTETPVNSKSNSQGIGRSPLGNDKLPLEHDCLHCNRSFRSRSYCKKHRVRCAKSLKSLSFGKFDQSPLLKTQLSEEQHHCLHCSDYFPSAFQLRGHMRIHSKLLNCDSCGHNCKSQQQLVLHQAECMIKGNETTAGKQHLPARRITRSNTQDCVDIELVSTTENNSKNCIPNGIEKNLRTYTNKKLETMPSTKRKHCDEKYYGSVKKSKSFHLTNSQCQDDDPHLTNSVHSTITNYLQSNKIAPTVSESPYNGFHHEFDNDGSDEEYSEDDDVSVADSIYLRRLSYTNRWLDTHNSLTSQTSFKEDATYLFKDLNLLERLRREVKLKEITCYEPNCSYITTSLNAMMLHDYISHFKNSRFFCRKCGKCFTSKIFLDYHLDIQDRWHNYLCHKCGFYFVSRHALHRHLSQHLKQRADEVEKLTCYCCSFVFLDKQSLSKHCDATGHDWRNRRQLIHIDHSRTISNMVPLENSTNSSNISYSVQNIEMHNVALSRQHSTSRERYNAKLRIGTVEFKEPWTANCVGMFGRQ